MATPVYSSGGYRRGGGYHRHSGQTSGPTNSGWVDRVSSWFGGATPQYGGQGQPTSGTIGGDTLVYMPAPQTIVTADAATTAPQASSLAIVVPRS